jgi:two-component system alkaline phosphatase synthesis response regulator PhoP
MPSQEVINDNVDYVLPDKVSILIVEDDEDICCLFDYILSNAGYSVESVDDGFKALEKIRENEFQITILDYMLPEIKKIRPNMKIVFVTGFPEYADKINNRRGALSQYALKKPVTQETLLQTIKMIE